MKSEAEGRLFQDIENEFQAVEEKKYLKDGSFLKGFGLLRLDKDVYARIKVEIFRYCVKRYLKDGDYSRRFRIDELDDFTYVKVLKCVFQFCEKEVLEDGSYFKGFDLERLGNQNTKLENLENLGIHIKPHQFKFIGRLRSGLRSGFGYLHQKKMYKYRGMFFQNQKNGEGQMYDFKKGFKIDGVWKKDRLMEYKKVENHEFVCLVKQVEKEIFGFVLYKEKKEVFIGFLSNLIKPNGFGVLFENSSIYLGRFTNGILNGLSFIQSSKYTYRGICNKKKLHGEGFLQNMSGTLTGTFEKNEFINKKVLNSEDFKFSLPIVEGYLKTLFSILTTDANIHKSFSELLQMYQLQLVSLQTYHPLDIYKDQNQILFQLSSLVSTLTNLQLQQLINPCTSEFSFYLIFLEKSLKNLISPLENCLVPEKPLESSKKTHKNLLFNYSLPIQQPLKHQTTFISENLSGHSTFMFPNKDIYDGEWEKGYFFGVGVYKTASGQCYILEHFPAGTLKSITKLNY